MILDHIQSTFIFNDTSCCPLSDPLPDANRVHCQTTALGIHRSTSDSPSSQCPSFQQPMSSLELKPIRRFNERNKLGKRGLSYSPALLLQGKSCGCWQAREQVERLASEASGSLRIPRGARGHRKGLEQVSSEEPVLSQITRNLMLAWELKMRLPAAENVVETWPGLYGALSPIPSPAESGLVTAGNPST